MTHVNILPLRAGGSNPFCSSINNYRAHTTFRHLALRGNRVKTRPVCVCVNRFNPSEMAVELEEEGVCRSCSRPLAWLTLNCVNTKQWSVSWSSCKFVDFRVRAYFSLYSLQNVYLFFRRLLILAMAGHIAYVVMKLCICHPEAPEIKCTVYLF